MLAMPPPIPLSAVVFVSILGAVFGWLLVSRQASKVLISKLFVASGVGFAANLAQSDGLGIIAFLSSLTVSCILTARWANPVEP